MEEMEFLTPERSRDMLRIFWYWCISLVCTLLFYFDIFYPIMKLVTL